MRNRTENRCTATRELPRDARAEEILDGIRRVAVIVLAAAVLTQIAACGTAPRKQLSDWNSPDDCATANAPATSRLAPDNGAAPALLVESFGLRWNCATIPAGRYDAEVVVRWSNGWQETALDMKDIDIASGQRLVAKAYERARGAIPASFSNVRAQPDSAHAAVESVTPGFPLESKIFQAPANESVIPASTLEPQVVEAQAPASRESIDVVPAAASPDQAPSSGGATAGESPHPAVTALKIAGVVVLVAAAIVLTRGEVLMHAGGGYSPPRDTKLSPPRRTGPSNRPSADCCFAWIEDGLTGEVIAGKHPFRN